ncbi:MAG: DNA polymerase/3'-5' exonuclease PolX [Solirubrobacteraceae bacterium]
MPKADPTNAEIADALQELGDLYELDGAIVHRVAAYRSAAKAVRESSLSVASLARQGRATELPGVGKTLQEKILALVETGTIPAAERLRAKFPPGLLALTRLPGLGPKRARLIFSELGIDSLQALREAAEAQRLRSVKGLGPKFEASVLEALAQGEGGTRGEPGRVILTRALEVGEALVEGLRRLAGPDAEVLLAGSIRRCADSVKDIDIVAVSDQPEQLARSLGQLEEIAQVSSAGRAGARGRTHAGIGVDLRIATPAQLGNLLQHFTGSGAHNAALREAAVRRGLHVSEYGILDDATGATQECATEQEVYERLGLQYIEPELREDRGELEAAASPGGLPRLIELSEIRGDLHSHTIASDGRFTIEEMGAAARQRGYEYLAITDHSASHGFGDAVSPDQLERQIELIGQANERLSGIELLAGSEVNILPDGSLDYDDELLVRLDWVIASVHTSFGMGEQAMTERMIAAIEHPLVRAIGHPTGRLIERRAPYALDLEAVFAAAARTGTMLEINGNPDRRDLSDLHARAAALAGVTIVIDSDAHRIDTLANMRWGIATARRAWLTSADVANTRPWAELRRVG